MDTLSLYYFSESAKDLNFTKTANRLYISQQNLSNHISRLEQTLGIALYERKPHLTLTYADECVLQFARNYQLDEDNLRNTLSDISLKEEGYLNIGFVHHRTSVVVPIIAEKFSQAFPHVTLNFYCRHTRELTEMLLQGELDFAIAVDKIHNTQIEKKFLFKDRVYLMVTKDLLQKYYGENSQNMLNAPPKGVCLNDYAKLPFVNIRSAKLISDVFECCNCKPNFLITVDYPHIVFTGFYEHIAASIITKTVYLHMKDRVAPDIIFLPINTPSSLSLHSISLLKNKQKKLSRYGKYFYNITVDYFHSLLHENTPG